jgi:hypothetical protein
VQINHVELVDGDVWFYTTGQVMGRLPLVGWVTVLSWQREPEVAPAPGQGLAPGRLPGLIAPHMAIYGLTS